MEHQFCKLTIILILAVIIIAGGCGSSGNSPVATPTPSSSTSPAPTSSASPTPTPSSSIVNTSAPSTTVKIIFIHHSVGQNWLTSGNGNLGTTLCNYNYYVSDSNYGWSAVPGDGIGDRTDTVNWPEWFTDVKMPYVYTYYSKNSSYTNTKSDSGGQNEIIMFKSCFPNSDVGDSMDDEKSIYNSLLSYFQSHTTKMFVLIVPPPQITISYPAKTRELANWLVNTSTGWLAGYSGNNVFVFDFYNVLTDPNKHHRVNSSGHIEHIITSSPARPAHPNELYYDSSGDSGLPPVE